MKQLYFIVVCFLVVLKHAYGGARPEIQSVGTWVTQNTYDYSPTHLDKDAEDGYVDIATEQQFHLAGQASYRRRVVRVLSDAGVQNISDISVPYDPSYGRLAFHSIQIIRAGRAINCLDLRKFKMVQKETESNRHIYNGTISAELFLEDVRKGDIIDYSYTITGWNPVTANRFSTFLATSYPYPFYHVYYKIVTPAARQLQVADVLTKVAFNQRSESGQTVYEWTLEDLKSVPEEDNTPSWFNTQNYAMVSEYKSWKEVADWAMKLYPISIPISGALKEMVDGIVAKNKTSEARLLAALHFVQDEVRYLGIEMGVNSHLPHDPAQIFRQRYGDCKDKAYLLCAMLRAMSIEADPVLISSSDKHSIAQYLPSPRDFDHVTVRARVNDKYYWLDGTISGQRGGLDDISYPDYQLGLVITPTTEGLTNIPLQDKGRKLVVETIDIPDMSGDARLKVVSRYSGSTADDARLAFDGSSHSEIQRHYKEYYATYFNRIEADSITTSEDAATGVFECREYYTLHDIWKMSADKQNTWFYAYVLNGDIHKPKDRTRKSPFALNYPLKCTEDVFINLPDDWNLSNSEETVQCASFTLKTKITYLLRKIHMHYEYEGMKDHVTTEELPEYLAAYEKADELLSYGITSGTGTHTEGDSDDNLPGKGSNRNTYTLLAVVVIFAGIAWRIKRKS